MTKKVKAIHALKAIVKQNQQHLDIVVDFVKQIFDDAEI